MDNRSLFRQALDLISAPQVVLFLEQVLSSEGGLEWQRKYEAYRENERQKLAAARGWEYKTEPLRKNGARIAWDEAAVLEAIEVCWQSFARFFPSGASPQSAIRPARMARRRAAHGTDENRRWFANDQNTRAAINNLVLILTAAGALREAEEAQRLVSSISLTTGEPVSSASQPQLEDDPEGSPVQLQSGNATRSPYDIPITRSTPGCVLFLLDMSNSMNAELSPGFSRAQFLADRVNEALYELIYSACFRNGEVRPYLDLGILSYGRNVAAPAFLAPALRNQPIASVVDVEQHYQVVTRRVISAAGEPFERKTAVWFEPDAGGQTPMGSALLRVGEIVRDWCDAHKGCFPPIIIHITDAEAIGIDVSPTAIVEAAMAVTSQFTMPGGHALLLNMHVGTGVPVRFPDDNTILPDNAYGTALFRASSMMPPEMLARAGAKSVPLRAGSRGYIYNGNVNDIAQFLEIGTHPLQSSAAKAN